MTVPEDRRTSRTLNTPATPGAPAGDFSNASDELLIDGQEEVFSRSEVEAGRIEHHTEAGGSEPRPSKGRTNALPPEER